MAVISKHLSGFYSPHQSKVYFDSEVIISHGWVTTQVISEPSLAEIHASGCCIDLTKLSPSEEIGNSAGVYKWIETEDKHFSEVILRNYTCSGLFNGFLANFILFVGLHVCG